jgi:hypothetical protein
MPDKRLKQIFGFLSFVIALTVYGMTVAPTVSFWDCGEFIACAFTQGVPHPPGSPLFLLVARLFTLILSFVIEDVALRVNIISVISSAFTVLFTYLIIVRFLGWMNGKQQDEEGHLIDYIGGFIGSLVFAFTYSFWFNAVEAEVYAPSMFFTAIIVWLIMRWADHHDEPGNERYLVLIAYMNGLAIGVHLLNILALPFIVYIFYFRKYGFNWNVFWKSTGMGMLITGFVFIGLVKKILIIPELFGFSGFAFFFILLLLIVYYSVKAKKTVTALALISVIMIVVGYSSYGYIYIRSGLDPTIDENDPETIEKFISYMEREQYGVSQGFKKDYLERKAPFWSYQVNKMYIRYFLWQFLGRNDRTEGVDYFRFLMLPLLLGLFGAYRQYKKSPEYAFANFVLWFMTGLAIILYLNQPDPQPRERDYSYVGSFFAFAIWVGIGAAELLRVLKEKKVLTSPSMLRLGGVALLIVPGIMVTRNFHIQDRSGNYVAWDYSYNMLAGLEENAIIYTNGDNDTFPLWYLQEVEGVRKDVRIANLSLLNTDWYIKQLRDFEPRIPIKFGDRQIESFRPILWKKEYQEQFFTVPEEVVKKSVAQFESEFPEEKGRVKASTKVSFHVPPNFGAGIKVADLMMLHIFEQTRLTRPVYYAATVSPDNMLGTLRDYMRMDGTVLKVTPIKNWVISPTELYHNLKDVFKFRNLNNPDVYYNNGSISLLQNYRAAFLQLIDYDVRHDNVERAHEIIELLNEKIPDSVIPYTNTRLKKLLTLFSVAAGFTQGELNGFDNSMLRDIEYFGNMFVKDRRYLSAANCFHFLVNAQPANLKYLRQYTTLLKRSNRKDELKSLLKEITDNPESDSTVVSWVKKELLLIDAAGKN